jgi:hypothetical protein
MAAAGFLDPLDDDRAFVCHFNPPRDQTGGKVLTACSTS